MSNDQEIYDYAKGEQTENAPETPVEAPQEPKSERARDERGKFVSARPEPTSQEAPEDSAPEEVSTPVETQPQAEKEDARVPSWRLAEEADRRRQAEQALNELRNEIRQLQMAQVQRQQPEAPQEPVDIFADPQGFVNQLQNTFDNRLKTLQLENSLRFAHYAHGDKFTEAYDNFMDHVRRTQDQASYQRVMASSDPGEALVKWNREQQLNARLGDSDLDTFIESQLEERLKDPKIQAKVIEAFKATQVQPGNTVTQLPPSLSKAGAARSAHDNGGSSSADIWAYAKPTR